MNNNIDLSFKCYSKTTKDSIQYYYIKNKINEIYKVDKLIIKHKIYENNLIESIQYFIDTSDSQYYLTQELNSNITQISMEDFNHALSYFITQNPPKYTNDIKL